MVAALKDPRTIIIIQARMGSVRLPGKVMRLIDGIPMIGLQLNRVKKSGYKIVVATSEEKESDPLCEYVQSLGIDVFRGSENNVLERYYQAAKFYNGDIIIRITGDNPLIDGKYIRSVMNDIDNFHERMYLSTGKSKTLPPGLTFEAFSFQILKEAFSHVNTYLEKEHVTTYMYQNIPGDIDIKLVKNDIAYSNIRLTVDTAADFQLVKTLVEDYNCGDKNMFEIIELLNEDSFLLSLNTGKGH